MNHLGLCLWVSDVYNSHSDGIFVKKISTFQRQRCENESSAARIGPEPDLVFNFLSLSSFLFFSLSDWEEEQVSSPNILRLIYQGRFLHGNVTLGGEKTQPAHSQTPSTESQQRAAGNYSAVLIPFPERQNRGGSVLRGQARFERWREERRNTGFRKELCMCLSRPHALQ